MVIPKQPPTLTPSHPENPVDVSFYLNLMVSKLCINEFQSYNVHHLLPMNISYYLYLCFPSNPPPCLPLSNLYDLLQPLPQTPTYLEPH